MAKVKILYVEDEGALARITGDALARSGFDVTWRQDGISANSAFQYSSFDICLIDVMIPRMDGYKLVQNIRRVNPDIPIMFLTARSLSEDVVKGFEIGANDYLKKPFSIEELIVRIRELVKRSVAKSVINYHFDYQRMELVYHDQSFSLTHRENEILKRLIENKNEVINTRHLVRELWGDDDQYNIRSLNVFISKIRSYLINDPNVQILNVRAVGYKLVTILNEQ